MFQGKNKDDEMESGKQTRLGKGLKEMMTFRLSSERVEPAT